jgi:hypothetical protein
LNSVGSDYQCPHHGIHPPLPGFEIQTGRQRLQVLKEFPPRSRGGDQRQLNVRPEASQFANPDVPVTYRIPVVLQRDRQLVRVFDVARVLVGVGRAEKLEVIWISTPLCSTVMVAGLVTLPAASRFGARKMMS